MLIPLLLCNAPLPHLTRHSSFRSIVSTILNGQGPEIGRSTTSQSMYKTSRSPMGFSAVCLAGLAFLFLLDMPAKAEARIEITNSKIIVEPNRPFVVTFKNIGPAGADLDLLQSNYDGSDVHLVKQLFSKPPLLDPPNTGSIVLGETRV